MVSIDSVLRAIRERFDSPIGEGNMAAAEAAFSKLRGAQSKRWRQPMVRLSAIVKAGRLKHCEFVNVESEFAAMSVAIGASDRGPGRAAHHQSVAASAD
jgi:hypothetical protein